MSEKHQCEVRVMDDVSSRFHPCLRNGTVERGGKWYCFQHDPVALQERDETRRAKWDAEAKASQETWERRAACNDACVGVSTKDLKPGMLAELLKEQS